MLYFWACSDEEQLPTLFGVALKDQLTFQRDLTRPKKGDTEKARDMRMRDRLVASSPVLERESRQTQAGRHFMGIPQAEVSGQ